MTTGHALMQDGKPYLQTQNGEWPTDSAAGFALCECGDASPRLTSDDARKRWHREHVQSLPRDGGPAEWDDGRPYGSLGNE